MVKRLTLILLLLVGSARAAITVSSAQNWSAIGATGTDSVIVASGGTLTLTQDHNATLAARIVIVQSGGVFNQAGYKILISALQLNGGKHYVSTNGAVYLRKDALYTYDYYIGANSTDSLDSRGTLLVHSDEPQTYGMARIYCDNSSAKVYWYRVSFAAMYRAAFSGGIQFSSSGRPGSLTYINRCSFDSVNVSFLNVRGHKIDSSTFLLWNGQSQAVMIQGGSRDTVSNSYLYCNSLGSGTLRGVYVYNSDTCVVSNTRIEAQNEGAYSSSGQAVGIDGTTSYTRIIGNTIIGFSQPITGGPSTDAGGNCVANIRTLISGNRFETGANTHEAIIIYCGDTGWIVQGNVFWGRATRSMINPYASKSPAPDGLQILYNTVIASKSGSNATTPVAFEHTSAGNLTYNRIKMVGNILVGDNTGFSRAEILFGTTSAQTVTVNFTEFKNNAFDSCYYYGSSSATYPYSRLDSNKHDQTAFAFVDSLTGDFRLDAASAMINCGDTLYGDSVFSTAQHSKIPYDIGYYQTYTTGTCGGAPSTPTGACCISYTCYTGYTAAACTTGGGTYQGDGTTTCTNCTLPQPQTGTFPHFAWIRTAAITYGLTDSIASKFLGRVGTDLVLNMSNTAYGSRSGNWDNYHAMNQYGKNLNYITASSYRSGSDLAELTTYCGLQGQAVVNDSFFIKVNTGTIGLYDVQSQGSPCAAGHITYTTSGNYLEFCGWTTSGRWEWDYTKRMARDFQIWRATKYMSGVYTASDGTKYAGVIEDENTTYKAGGYNEPPGNSMAFPHGSGAWVSGSSGSAQCGPWAGYTYAQILDSLTNLKQNVWLKQIGDTGRKYTGFWFANSVTYGVVGSDKVPGDIVKTNTGVWPMENALFCLSAVGQGDPATWNGETWKIMDTIYVRDTGFAIVWCNVNRLDTVALVSAAGASPTGTARAKLQRLCYYYMAHHPDRTYFMLTSNSPEHTANDYKKTDTLYKFTKAIYHNIGRPTGLRTAAQTGTDGAGQAYTIYRRNFQNGVVIYRADNGSNRGDASAVTFSLGATYYPAFEDSSVGAPTSTATIRNCEGKIFLTSTAASTGNASIDDVSVTEGGNMTFTVTLSAAQAVPTTISYSTSDGTATGSTSCTGSYDYVSTIGGKSIPIGSTSTTITIPTCNRASCQASRAFTVTFNVTSPATITVTDAIGTGTILDDDCGTTYGKTYKGKIVIKGKVKP